MFLGAGKADKGGGEKNNQVLKRLKRFHIRIPSKSVLSFHAHEQVFVFPLLADEGKNEGFLCKIDNKIVHKDTLPIIKNSHSCVFLDHAQPVLHCRHKQPLAQNTAARLPVHCLVERHLFWSGFCPLAVRPPLVALSIPPNNCSRWN
jgi:hypothetical protein